MPQHRRGLRSMEAAHRWRRNAGLVDFAMFPHLDHEDCRKIPWPMQRSGPRNVVPAYAIDDQTASKWSTVPSTSSPRDTGNFSLLSTERRRGFLRDVWSSSLKTIAREGSQKFCFDPTHYSLASRSGRRPSLSEREGVLRIRHSHWRSFCLSENTDVSSHVRTRLSIIRSLT